MQISQWLKQQDITATAFAAAIGVSISTITRIARGEVMPSPDTLRKIMAETGGAVSANDFFTLPTEADFTDVSGEASAKPEAA